MKYQKKDRLDLMMMIMQILIAFSSLIAFDFGLLAFIFFLILLIAPIINLISWYKDIDYTDILNTCFGTKPLWIFIVLSLIGTAQYIIRYMEDGLIYDIHHILGNSVFLPLFVCSLFHYFSIKSIILYDILCKYKDRLSEIITCTLQVSFLIALGFMKSYKRDEVWGNYINTVYLFICLFLALFLLILILLILADLFKNKDNIEYKQKYITICSYVNIYPSAVIISGGLFLFVANSFVLYEHDYRMEWTYIIGYSALCIFCFLFDYLSDKICNDKNTKAAKRRKAITISTTLLVSFYGIIAFFLELKEITPVRINPSESTINLPAATITLLTTIVVLTLAVVFCINKYDE